jgi:hypothetical protein
MNEVVWKRWLMHYIFYYLIKLDVLKIFGVFVLFCILSRRKIILVEARSISLVRFRHVPNPNRLNSIISSSTRSLDSNSKFDWARARMCDSNSTRTRTWGFELDRVQAWCNRVRVELEPHKSSSIKLSSEQVKSLFSINNR